MVTKKMIRTHDAFAEKKIRLVTTLDLIKLINQQKLLLTCAPISMLPSNITIGLWIKQRDALVKDGSKKVKQTLLCSYSMSKMS